jgi:16S rRNA processing protein RimM
MADTAKPRVCLGRILGAHGLAGEVLLKTFTDQATDVAAYGPLQDEDGSRVFEIVKLRPAKRGAVARLKGVDSRRAAEALKGVVLYVDRAMLPSPDEEEWYYADLIGLSAEDAAGAPLGNVVAVQNFGAEDLLEIKPVTGGPTVFVPFRQATVPEIDLDKRRLVLNPPDGLLQPRDQ